MNRQFAKLLAFAVALILWTPLRAGTVDDALATHIASLPGDAYVDVIIRFTDKVDPKNFKDKNLKKRLKRMLKVLKRFADKKDVKDLKRELKTAGARGTIDLWILNGLAVSVRVDKVHALARRRFVETVSLDARIARPAAIGDWPAETNLQAVGVQDLWTAGYDGAGVVVATMDTGVDASHPDIGPRYRGGSNSWFDPHGEHGTPYDAAAVSNGHGTHVMGVLVGGDASGSALGVAPGAQWIAVKIFDDAGDASYSDIHQGFQWLLDPDGDSQTHDAPDVVNNSWFLDGPPNSCNTEFEADIATLRAAGIAMVFAAGNTGPGAGSGASPANNAEGFAVGAVDVEEAVINSSARGPSACTGEVFPTIVAPGQGVTTVDHTFGLPIPFTTQVTGTSIAAPHVSGGMAILKQAFPAATVSELESAIREGAVDLGATGSDDDYGDGMLDLVAAYDWLVLNGGSSQPGEVQFSAENYSVSEAGANVTITINRTGGNAGDITVDYATSDGTATAGEDYQAASNTLTLLDGEASQTFSIAILDDSVHEGDEDLTLALSNPTGGATLGTPTQATLTLIDDDSAGPLDNDGDGFTSDLDCDDADASVYPGAPEIKYDGIDQDCNGYDLTIDITRARYIAAKDKLVIWATSDLNNQAGLRAGTDLAAGGNIDLKMSWKANKSRWARTVNGFVTKFDSQPLSVTVYGIEGAESIPVDLR